MEDLIINCRVIVNVFIKPVLPYFSFYHTMVLKKRTGFNKKIAMSNENTKYSN